MIRKTFYDMWDNFLAVLVMNVGFMLIVGMIYGISLGLTALIPLLSVTIIVSFGVMLLILVVASCLYSLYAGVVSCLVRDIADHGRPALGKIPQYLKETWKSSLLFGLIQGLLLGLLINAGTYYLPAAGSNFLFYLLFFTLLWVYLLWFIASQYFFPLQARFDKKLRKNIRKMFVLFFDNTAFTLFGLSLVALLTLGISIITVLLIPGLTTLHLLYAVALKLRVLKYDYLDANPGANRKKIPWDTLLIEEREKTGKRTLRNLIFPWKD